MFPIRKTITVNLECIFEGDYIPSDQIPDYLEQWLESGLVDRDDLIEWTASCGPVREIPAWFGDHIC